ncbi:MAG: hypothetical protein MZU91_12320 [Desulfosudis oleivorans]|nr:hypothetical protein [Desulfosudis oleivorans]
MRLTRRTFIMASGAAAGWLATGCATTTDPRPPGPVTSAFVPRKAKASAPAQGDWVGSTCQGCTQWCAIQIFVQDGRAVRVRGNPLSKTNHGYRLPARPHDPAADVRPRPREDADEAHQPGQGPRHRSEVRAHQLGRGAGHRGRQDDRAAPGRRAAAS